MKLKLFAAMLCLCSLNAFAGKQLPPQNQLLPLFTITKDVNTNTVIYEANVSKNCQFDPKDPVKIHWAMGDGTTQGLNFFERRLYPIEASQITPTQVTGQVKALQKKKLNYPMTINLEVTDGKCEARVSSVDLVSVQTVRLEKFDGLSPNDVIILGTSANGEHVSVPLLTRGNPVSSPKIK